MEKEKHTGSYSLEALKTGDRAEFARLVEDNYNYIYRLAIKILGTQQDAEDVLQETFLKAYRNLKGFDGRSSLSTWLYRIATNEALMLLRKRKPEEISIEEPLSEESSEQEPLQIVDWCCLPEQELLTDEAKAALEQAAAELPLSLRVVFLLRDIEGLSTRETAEVLELSEMAVKTRLSRARLRLREELSGYFSERMAELRKI